MPGKSKNEIKIINHANTSLSVLSSILLFVAQDRFVPRHLRCCPVLVPLVVLYSAIFEQEKKPSVPWTKEALNQLWTSKKQATNVVIKLHLYLY